MPQNFESIMLNNFNGGVVTSVDPLLLKLNELADAKNIRYSRAGGFTNRPGYSQKIFAGFSGTNGMKGKYATADEIFFVNNGKLYVTLKDGTNAFEILSGLSATAKCRFLEYGGNLYLYNGVDELKRIAISEIQTALTAGVSTSVTVGTGAGYKYPTTGDVMVVTAAGVDTITVTGKANDVLTITAATVTNNASIGDKIYYIISIPDSTANQRFKAAAELDNRLLAAIPSGKAGSVFLPNVLLIGRAVASASNIDLFHDFVGSGAGAVPIGDKGAITGLYKTKGGVVIAKKNALYICTGFQTNGAPIIQPITQAYGGASQDSAVLVGDQLLMFTGREIKQLGEQVGLNNTTPSINPQFDDKIYSTLKDLDEDQSDSFAVFNPAQRLYKLWVKQNGSTICITYDDKIDAWNFDKNAIILTNGKVIAVLHTILDTVMF
jgi:hypothetical protein